MAHAGLIKNWFQQSNGKKTNTIFILDIVIGAYMSDAAYLLYGQSVINLDISIDTTVNLIDKDTKITCKTTDGKKAPCFGVEVCFNYINRLYGTIGKFVFN